MSFKRFDPEDIVLSSELITFPTWYTQEGGDTSHLDMESAIERPEQGFSVDYYKDYYSVYQAPEYSICNEDTQEEETITPEPEFDELHSKALFSLAYAARPADGIHDFTPRYNPVTVLDKDKTYYILDETGTYQVYTNKDPETGEYIIEEGVTYYEKDESIKPSEIVFGQYRSLVLGDEDSDFRFGNTKVSSTEEIPCADSFIALSVDRARFREKLDPNTCRINLQGGKVLAPDISANRRYLDAGRVFDLAERSESLQDGKTIITYNYPTGSVGSSAATSYGYFLPDIGVILFNTSNNAELFGKTGPEDETGNSGEEAGYDTSSWSNIKEGERPAEFKEQVLASIDLRSQETITSNFVFVRARNAEFNYSTNPSNITGSAGNIRHDVMINQPQSFITTVGLYNDANELLAVAKLSRPLIKDFTKEALIRIKLDY